MKLPDLIILAGGKGTRLQHIVNEVPKPMAPVAGKPFLDYLLHYVVKCGFRRIFLSVGYKKENIISHYGKHFMGADLYYVIEDEPLGTGGGVKLAMQHTQTEEAVVLNGDTFVHTNPADLLHFHRDKKSSVSVMLKTMPKPDRYGTVTLKDNIITAFEEKQPGLKEGLINAGVYCISKSIHWPDEDSFSFETRILQPLADARQLAGMVTDGFFIDIGIPEDYYRANDIFKTFSY